MTCWIGDSASFNALLGDMSVIAVDMIGMKFGAKTWSTRGGSATLISRGQALAIADPTYIDTTDNRSDAIVAGLCVFKVSEIEDRVMGGTLCVVGEGAWAVTCSGP
jgi:hypothetical protein